MTRHSHHISTNDFIGKVFLWMFIGMMVSFGVAFYTASSEWLLKIIFSSQWTFFGLIILQLILVFTISFFATKLPTPIGIIMFVLYSLFTGLTLSVIFLAFSLGSIAMVFLVSALMFAGMAIFGYTTKTDLTAVGTIAIFAILAIIIISIINLFFLKSSFLETIISGIAVLIFAALTAYDLQKLKELSLNATDKTTLERYAVIGALSLYLDFINIFLNLLQLIGDRN